MKNIPESDINQDPHTLSGDHDSIVVEDTPTPLPKLQLFAVLVTELAVPITVTCIYPFINQFIRETGITKGDERKTGYYAGIIESAFSLSESLSVVQWGYLSDRLGRRPILLLGPFGLVFATLSFGFSKQFLALVVVRCFQGIFAGNVGVTKPVIAELTDSTNIGDAFAWIPLIWSIGGTIAPVIGGVLSNPAVRFPKSLGRIVFLREHPYFLPCAVAGLLSFAAWAIAYVCLKETSPVALARKKWGKRTNGLRSEEFSIYGAVSEESDMLVQGEHTGYGTRRCKDNELSNITPQSSTTENSSIAALMTKPLILIYLNRTCLGFLEMCIHVLLPLMYSTSIPLGGLGLDPFRIGVALGSFGFINSIVQFNYLGRMMRKLGPRKVYIISFMAFLNCFATYPFMSHFAQRAGRVDGIVLMLMVVQLASQMGIYTAYGAIQVVLVENVPPGGGMATANGLAQMMSSAMRTIAPAFAASLFSISLTKGLLGGHLVYYLLLAITLMGIRLSHHLPEGRNRGFS